MWAEEDIEDYEYFWYVDPDSIPVGPVRVRVMVTDSGQNVNLDYSARLEVVHPDSSVILGVEHEGPGLEVTAIRPNPTSRDVTIRFSLARASEVLVEIYDVAGRRVRRLSQGIRAAGLHDVVWDGRRESGHRLQDGVYFCQLKDRERTQVFKIVLMRQR